MARSPFRRALVRGHLSRHDGTPSDWKLVTLTWVPLMIGALVQTVTGGAPAPILFDISVHVRLLVGIPLLLEAERLLDQRCRGVVKLLYEGRFVEPSALDAILDRVERARDSHVEHLLLAAALIAGQSALWGMLGPTGAFAGISDPGSISFARIWYATLSLPIAQFLMLRWLWHWLLWSYVLVRLSRLPVRTIAMHPDQSAGIAFLAIPISAFTGFVASISATISAAWVTQVLNGNASALSFVPSFVTLVILVLLIACGPQLAFVGTLYRARVRDVAKYNLLALEYVLAFHFKWVEAQRGPEPLLGSPDIQSLNDMMGAYGGLVQVRLVPFGRRAVVIVFLAAAIPMLPLVAATMPINDLLLKITQALIGLP